MSLRYGANQATGMCGAVAIALVSMVVGGCSKSAKETPADGGGQTGCLKVYQRASCAANPVQVVEPAGVRVAFSVETCDGEPVPDALGLAAAGRGAIEVFEGADETPIQSNGNPEFVSAFDVAGFTAVVLDLSDDLVASGKLDGEINGARELVRRLVTVPSPRLRQSVAIYVVGSATTSAVWTSPDGGASFSRDADVLNARLESLRGANGRGTRNMFGAFVAAVDLVSAQGADACHAMRSVVVMTGGGDESYEEGLHKRAVDAAAAFSKAEGRAYAIAFQGDDAAGAITALAGDATSRVQLATDASESLQSAFGAVAARIEAWSRSNYVAGICSPAQGPNRSVTIRVTREQAQGELSVAYDATGFDAATCKAADVADPCSAAECGEVSGVLCGTCGAGSACQNGTCGCPAGTKPCGARCIDEADCCTDGDCAGAGDTCDEGVCRCGASLACEAGNQCVAGECRCGSGAACSGASDTCVAGACRCGTTPSCSGSADTCVAGECRCGAGAACSGSADSCSAGECRCGAAPACSGGGQCTNGCCPGMVALPGGTFTMGVRGDRVTILPLCMDATEVTVQAYTACVTSGACTAAGTSPATCNGTRADRSNHPINCVNWNQATAYCAVAGKRLPTEEEFEWAARGTTRGSDYPWGNDTPWNQACWNGDGNDAGYLLRKSTCPVGSYPAGDTPQGIHDLGGNVWEWTSTQIETGLEKVDRGGGWQDGNGWVMRSSVRGKNEAAVSNHLTGFRCVNSR